MTFASIQGYFEVPEVLKTKTGFIEEPRVAFNPPVGRRLTGRATATYNFEEARAPRMVVKMAVCLDATGKSRVGVILEFLATSTQGIYNVRTRIPRGYAMENVTFLFTDRSKTKGRDPFSTEIAFGFDLFAQEPDQAEIQKAKSIDCVICMDKPASVLITDCGHAVMCANCVPKFLEAPVTLCPVCRAKATHLRRFDDTENALLPHIKI